MAPKKKAYRFYKTHNLQGRVLLRGWTDNSLAYLKKSQGFVLYQTGVNKADMLVAALKKALHKNGEPVKKTIHQYLNTPETEVFTGSILRAI